MNIFYREAEDKDTKLILQFIKELAVYERLEHEVVAKEDDIRNSLFCEQPKAFAYIIEYNNEPVGFALCFYNYSTFQGKAGIYLEDLFIRESHRGLGIGKGFFKFLAQKAVNENCGRLQWWVLDWNKPSIEFYKGLGSKEMSEWIVMRIEGEQLKELAR